MKFLPPNALGIVAEGKVTADDYKQILFPAFERYAIHHRKLNYLLLLDTSVSNFTVEAWLNDMVLGCQYLTRWNKVAIVTDQLGVVKFTEIFGKLVPGEYKGFTKSQLAEAIAWVAS